MTATLAARLTPASTSERKLCRPMRLLLALPGLHRVARGAEVAMESIAEGLAQRGHRVTVVGSGHPRPGTTYRFIHAGCVPREKFESFPRIPTLRDHYSWEELTFAPGLAHSFVPGDYDATIACSYPWTNWILRARAGRHGPVHLFVTQNGDWMACATNREFRFFGCDGLVCTNPEYFERNRHRHRCRLIPNGVDPNLFHPGRGDRARFGLSEQRPVVLMVSALIPSKRVIEGIRAVAQAGDVQMFVAGAGEMREEVEKLGAELLPGRFVCTTVPRSDMPLLYRSADVFLHMSLDEPSANAYIEALASGLPIVTHDRAVTRWTLENTSELVDATALLAVADAIRRVLGEPRTAQAVNERVQLVRRRFTWQAIAAEYEAFLGEIRELRDG
jgi:glycosyltransferase involved in cell wall biosynthesis